MAGEKEWVKGYLGTVERLEPDIHPIDSGAFYASAAISLKRIADAADKIATHIATPAPLIIGPVDLMKELIIEPQGGGLLKITRKR